MHVQLEDAEAAQTRDDLEQLPKLLYVQGVVALVHLPLQASPRKRAQLQPGASPALGRAGLSQNALSQGA